MTTDGRRRVVIRDVTPEVDCGRFAAKRVTGDRVAVEADVYADGHDKVAAVVRHRRAGASAWEEAAMQPLANDRWRGSFRVGELGLHEYTVDAWVDRFGTWARDLAKRVAAGVETHVDLLAGADLTRDAADRAGRTDATRLTELADLLADEDESVTERAEVALGEELALLMERHDDRRYATTYERVLPLWVDRERARFSAWYELFPRSASPEPGRHGTLQDVIDHSLPYVAELGFDVLYLSPVHPIGTTYRKGKNNVVTAEPDDVGSPWAIGSPDGGHDAVHPNLGTVDDLRKLVVAAQEHGIEIAMDVAFQCSPDHPWVTEHPEWFRSRPDGTIQYAENPPKKYQDIYPLDFESDDWEGLWAALKGVFDFWVDQGVRIFRVDNPHTKAFAFWEWCIAEVQRAHPDTIFLSEAFTRPKVMYELAKRGFTQGYTYFTWRNHAYELEQYFAELTQTGVADYFRPNAWPNTPDILPENLQFGGRAGFVARLVLAATLSANYGIYGPAFELMESVPREPGSEEYLDSEKYQLRQWDLDRGDSLGGLIARVNRIRRQNPALHDNRTLRFHRVDNPQLLCYSKVSPDARNAILCVVNLDPNWKQSGWVHLDLEQLGFEEDDASFQVHDLIGESRYLWSGPVNFVELDPHVTPAHVFVVRRHVKSEHDFDYFL